MSMENLWAPWRVKYITKIVKEAKGCVFCRIYKQKKDAKNFVVVRTRHSYAVLNIYPYNNGHTLVLPNRHVNDIDKLRKTEQDDLFALLASVKALIKKTMRPQGFNIGINLGRSAGAGFPGHVHIHIVPRWRGDANFMPVIGKTKVISQSLRETYTLLKNAHSRRIRKT
jgi:ATP adenylyltransferase